MIKVYYVNTQPDYYVNTQPDSPTVTVIPVLRETAKIYWVDPCPASGFTKQIRKDQGNVFTDRVSANKYALDYVESMYAYKVASLRRIEKVVDKWVRTVKEDEQRTSNIPSGRMA